MKLISHISVTLTVIVACALSTSCTAPAPKPAPPSAAKPANTIAGVKDNRPPHVIKFFKGLDEIKAKAYAPGGGGDDEVVREVRAGVLNGRLPDVGKGMGPGFYLQLASGRKIWWPIK